GFALQPACTFVMARMAFPLASAGRHSVDSVDRAPHRGSIRPHGPCNCLIGSPGLLNAFVGPRGGVVTQRSAKPCTPVQFRPWPPPAAEDVRAGSSSLSRFT